MNADYPATTDAPPRQFSDLAVSPYGNPASLLTGEVRVAFAGRTSTEDKQDPRQSLIRQLDKSKFALPEAWVIVAHYFDVESGRKDVAERGHGADVAQFDIPIPRDGGIDDLLMEATRPDRKFDVVICENMSRLARQLYGSLTVERQLEQAGMALFASNEPIQLTTGRAQQILQRRINQSVAEYEALNILETSWGGLCTHIRDGYNIGQPAYGYKAKTFRHPNPAKAAKGATKSRLEPDGIKAEAVTQIAHWRYHERLGYNTIADRLNADHEKYPPPEAPCKRRSRGNWSKSSVRDILFNPKYTGYQVFNRRATTSASGRCNPPEKWIWSPQPTHEPLIPKWMHHEITATSRDRERTLDGNTLNRHPLSKRVYVMRGMIKCECGRRMRGIHDKGLTYYKCWLPGNNRGNDDLLASHPKTVNINEQTLLGAVTGFYIDRLFSPSRDNLLMHDIEEVDNQEAAELASIRQRLERQEADIKTRQLNVLQQAQTAGPEDPFGQALRRTYNELENARLQVTRKLTELDSIAASTDRPSPQDAELLHQLPYLESNLARAPQTLLRQLFEATHLNIVVHHDDDCVSVELTLAGDYLQAVSEIASPLKSPTTPETSQVSTVDIPSVHLVGTPSGVPPASQSSTPEWSSFGRFCMFAGLAAAAIAPTDTELIMMWTVIVWLPGLP